MSVAVDRSMPNEAGEPSAAAAGRGAAASSVLAKQIEEQMLYKDMRTDAAGQVLRRLAYARPPKPAPNGEAQP